MKKKPLAHGPHSQEGVATSMVPGERWVTAVTALPHTDLVASGMETDYHHKYDESRQNMTLTYFHYSSLNVM